MEDEKNGRYAGDKRDIILGASWLDRMDRSPYSRETLTSNILDTFGEGLTGLIQDNCSSMKKGKVIIVSPKVDNLGSLKEVDPNMAITGSNGFTSEVGGDKGLEGLVGMVMKDQCPIDGKLVKLEQDINGRSCWYMISCMPISDTKGTLSKMLILSMDVSEIRNEFETVLKELKDRDFIVSNLTRELDAVLSRSELTEALLDMTSSLTMTGSFVVETGSMKVLGSAGMEPLLGSEWMERGDLGSLFEFISEKDKSKVRSFILGPHIRTGSLKRKISFCSCDGKGMTLTLETFDQSKGSPRNFALCVVREDASSIGRERDGSNPDDPSVFNEPSLFKREERIIELKEEVNKLLYELGRPLKYANDRI